MSQESDDYYDDIYDRYDIHPTKTRSTGGSVNKPFHSGKGVRAKETFIAKALIRSTIQKNDKKPCQK